MQDKYPKISIVIVTYNAEAYLENAIQSAISQDYPNQELIIIDGKSTDTTVDIIQKYNTQITYWVSEPDRGIYDAMNKGIDQATGEWLYFLGSDDTLYEGILKKVFEGNPYQSIDFLYGNARFKHKNRVYDGKFNYLKLIHANICHQAIFFKKTIFQKIGKFSLKYKIYADWHFNILCFAHESLKIKHVDALIAVYNDFGSSSKVLDVAFRKDKSIFVVKLFKSKVPKKNFYRTLNDSIFDLIKYDNFFRAWYEVLSAGIYLRKPFYYIKNGFYWSKKRILRKI